MSKLIQLSKCYFILFELTKDFKGTICAKKLLGVRGQWFRDDTTLSALLKIMSTEVVVKECQG